MALRRLTELDDWHVSDKDEDIRGRQLQARGGEHLGTIEDMLVDTDAKLVRTVILDNGQRYSAEEIDIESDGVFIEVGRAHEGEAPARAVRSYPRESGTDRPRRVR